MIPQCRSNYILKKLATHCRVITISVMQALRKYPYTKNTSIKKITETNRCQLRLWSLSCLKITRQCTYFLVFHRSRTVTLLLYTFSATLFEPINQQTKQKHGKIPYGENIKNDSQYQKATSISFSLMEIEFIRESYRFRIKCSQATTDQCDILLYTTEI